MGELPTTKIEPATAEDVFSAAHTLGDILAKTPQYIAFLDTLQVVNHDPQIQQISARIRHLRSQMQYFQHTPEQAQEMEKLENELESLPVVQAYRKMEADLHQLMVQVDQSLGQIIGMPFAANAKRSCCG